MTNKNATAEDLAEMKRLVAELTAKITALEGLEVPTHKADLRFSLSNIEASVTIDWEATFDLTAAVGGRSIEDEFDIEFADPLNGLNCVSACGSVTLTFQDLDDLGELRVCLVDDDVHVVVDDWNSLEETLSLLVLTRAADEGAIPRCATIDSFEIVRGLSGRLGSGTFKCGSLGRRRVFFDVT